jgi:hypothetical protein
MELRLAAWVRQRVREPSTWMGVAMIAVVMGGDPIQAQNLAEAISLIVGGGLVAAAQRHSVRPRSKQDGATTSCGPAAAQRPEEEQQQP